MAHTFSGKPVRDGYMRRTVAVTGATGFIGRTIVRVLHEAGWSVRILVRSPGKAKSLAEFAQDQVQGSLSDKEGLRRLMAGVYAVVHCAGAVRGVTQAQFDVVNVDGMANVIDAAAQQDVAPRILLLSSLAAREPALSPYAASKWKGENILKQNADGIPWAALRPPAVYGPGDTELLPLFRVMARGVAPILGTRESRFSMIHVEDLAMAVLRWLTQDPCVTGVFELHDGKAGGYSWAEVIDTVGGLCHRKVMPLPIPAAVLMLPAVVNWVAGVCLPYAPMFTPGKLRELKHHDWVCDNMGFTQATGWTPSIPLAPGLRQLPGWPGFAGTQGERS
jgi:nucleoside-diphosphate-sugar epimerase